MSSKTDTNTTKADAYSVKMDGALRGAELAITNAYARAGGDWIRSDYIRGMQDTIAAVRAILNIPDERTATSPYVVATDTGWNTGINPEQPFVPPPGTPTYEPIIAKADANGNPISDTIRDFYGNGPTLADHFDADGNVIAL